MGKLISEANLCGMTEHFEEQSIARYLSGESPVSEREQIEHRMEVDPEFRERVNEVRQIWDWKSGPSRTWDLERGWRDLESRLREPARERDERFRKGRMTRYRPSWMIQMGRVAAVLAVAALLSLFVFRLTVLDEEPTPLALEEVVTNRGQKAELRLTDGSRIRLNSESSLTYPKEFDKEGRVVHLTGEAYFDIAREERPFFVYAEGVVIEILGTEFNVHSYSGENEVEVVVVEGKVSVGFAPGASGEPVILVEREMARLKQQEKSVSVTRDVDLASHLEWLDNRLTFDDAPLGEVARRLERWYGVDIRLTDPELERRHFSATFDDEPLQEALRILELSLDLDVRMENQTIFFSKK